MNSGHTPAALKEWAVVCDALATGTQSILLRKGGIHEGPEGFQPEHAEFWLFPTGFHQSTDGVRLEFTQRANEVLSQPVVAGTISVQFFSSVKSVHWIDHEQQLAALQPFHILTNEALARRFHYRQPGLYALVVETRSLSRPITLPSDPRYDGCHSWVTLNQSLSTSALQPAASQVVRLASQARQVLEKIS